MGKNPNAAAPQPEPPQAPEPETIAQQEPLPAIPGPATAPALVPPALVLPVLKRAEPTEAQQLLERVLAVRSSFLASAVALEKTLASIRGRQERPEVVSEPPARAQTGFFVALALLVRDQELTAARIAEQVEELRTKF